MRVTSRTTCSLPPLPVIRHGHGPYSVEILVHEHAKSDAIIIIKGSRLIITTRFYHESASSPHRTQSILVAKAEVT